MKDDRLGGIATAQSVRGRAPFRAAQAWSRRVLLRSVGLGLFGRATVSHLRGVGPALELNDPLGRPLPPCLGTPSAGVLA